MRTYADLEAIIQRFDDNRYSVEFQFLDPESDAETQVLGPGDGLISIDRNRLRELEVDPAGYGRQLSADFYANARVKEGLSRAISMAKQHEVGLRVRLVIGPSAPELQNLRWETLLHPDNETPLLTNEQIFFSRFLGSADWRPVKPRPRGQLRALVVIANPTDLNKFSPNQRKLAPVDVEGELARAKTGLGTIWTDVLASAGTATLKNIDAYLRKANRENRPYDLLYLVAHGALVRDTPRIYLENEKGEAGTIGGAELIDSLAQLQQPPRLVLLVSCQSAGSGGVSLGDGGAMASMGPQLAEAGVPAVIAMQGEVSMDTMAALLPAFFGSLQQDGLIDRALAVARNAVREVHDWWMPVLFMRLRRGGLWYTPGFSNTFEKWPALARHIQRQRCTLLLGPRSSEALLGSPQDIARRWAESYHFPMAPHDREDLPQVAQYLSVFQDKSFPREQLIEYLKYDLRERYRDELPEHAERLSLVELFQILSARERERNPNDTYKVLAAYPFPIFITANYSNMLYEALVAAGKQPVVELCRWNDDLELEPSIFDREREPDYQPTPERPLIFHLFGSIEKPESLVVTEDDYFDYLIGVTKNNELIPSKVRRAFTDSALLFLGFRMDDWAFRVLFRSIVGREGRLRSKGYAHIGAQIEPEEGRVIEPERARRYLNDYFHDADINVFWGGVEDFIRELQANASPTESLEQAVGKSS